MTLASVFQQTPTPLVEVTSQCAELCRSPGARVIATIYRALRCGRRRRLGRPLMDVVLRLEKGAMRSATARDLLAALHGVWVGAHSYGELFTPGVIPPGVTIGRYCSFGPGVRLFPRNHPLNLPSTHPYFYDASFGITAEDRVTPGSLRIGHDVWVGAGAMVTPGCREIGTGAVIGAAAVVTHDVPPYAIVAGNPARLLRYRFDENGRRRLLESRWWELSPERAFARANAVISKGAGR